MRLFLEQIQPALLGQQVHERKLSLQAQDMKHEVERPLSLSQDDLSVTQLFENKDGVGVGIKTDFLQDFRDPVSFYLISGKVFSIPNASKNGVLYIGADTKDRLLETKQHPIRGSISASDIKPVTEDYRTNIKDATVKYLTGCDIIRMPSSPRDASSVKALSNASYVLVENTDQLFYINKAQGKCIEINLGDSSQKNKIIAAIKSEMKPLSEPKVLSDLQVTRIGELTKQRHFKMSDDEVQQIISYIWSKLKWPFNFEKKAVPVKQAAIPAVPAKRSDTATETKYSETKSSISVRASAASEVGTSERTSDEAGIFWKNLGEFTRKVFIGGVAGLVMTFLMSYFLPMAMALSIGLGLGLGVGCVAGISSCKAVRDHRRDINNNNRRSSLTHFPFTLGPSNNYDPDNVAERKASTGNRSNGSSSVQAPPSVPNNEAKRNGNRPRQ